jgi:hypothetical protein
MESANCCNCESAKISPLEFINLIFHQSESPLFRLVPKMKPVHKFLERKKVEFVEKVDEIQVDIPPFFKSVNQRKFSHGGDEKRIKIFIKSMGETFAKIGQEKSALTYFLALMQSLRDTSDAITNTTILQMISMVIDEYIPFLFIIGLIQKC